MPVHVPVFPASAKSHSGKLNVLDFFASGKAQQWLFSFQFFSIGSCQFLKLSLTFSQKNGHANLDNLWAAANGARVKKNGSYSGFRS